MSRIRRPLLAIMLCAFATLARAGSLRLTSPAAGTTLRGGSFAELRWSAGQLPASSEEWEAFLSIDGGKYYAFRVTPHLDIALRSFTFVVPNVDTKTARILIRTGDEVHEAHFETADFFSIERDPNAERVVSHLLQFGRGEAARDGDPAVLSWTEGPRNGSATTQQSSTNIPVPALSPLPEAGSDAQAAIAPAVHHVAAPVTVEVRRVSCDRYLRSAEPLVRSDDLLLVCRRLNI